MAIDDVFTKNQFEDLKGIINSTAENEKPTSSDYHSQENKVVLTEMGEFLRIIQPDNYPEDVFMEEYVGPIQEPKQDDLTIHDEEEVGVFVGKGLSGTLNLLKEEGGGVVKETIYWGGRKTDKKKSKLVGMYDNEIRIERRDGNGRELTPKEAFRLDSHKFHGKGPGKRKQEKRMRQYETELKIKQMKNTDTPLLMVERMRYAQAQLKTPYLVLNGHVKPGQTRDPTSGFATVEKVDQLLGIKRKHEGQPKKPKS